MESRCADTIDLVGAVRVVAFILFLHALERCTIGDSRVRTCPVPGHLPMLRSGMIDRGERN